MPHTPGPWFINGPWHVQATTLKSGDHLPCVVAQVIQGHHVKDDERLGNARLIAAAPELLAALERLLENSPYQTYADSCECGENGNGLDDKGNVCEHIQACRAIAKVQP